VGIHNIVALSRSWFEGHSENYWDIHEPDDMPHWKTVSGFFYLCYVSRLDHHSNPTLDAVVSALAARPKTLPPSAVLQTTSYKEPRHPL